ncbi:MAG: hypothetical protein JWN22_3873 [Nocardioides sp.]|nr:hypothetical protein [Nocardioides sp.]
MTADYCELCELPLSTCVHGMPPAPPPAQVVATPRVRAVRERSARTAGSPPAPPVQRKWTPTEEFRPHILRILADADGRLEADDLMLELEIRLEDTLTAGDRERSPQGGDRWHVAVRRQRKALIDEGLLVPAQPGVWQLTPEGLAGQ